MVSYYILISTKNSYEHDVAEKLSKIDEVVDVEPLLVGETSVAEPFFDDYELIAKVKVNHTKDIKKIVDAEVHPIFGVEKTKIMIRQKA